MPCHAACLDLLLLLPLLLAALLFVKQPSPWQLRHFWTRLYTLTLLRLCLLLPPLLLRRNPSTYEGHKTSRGKHMLHQPHTNTGVAHSC